jgi:hypothetical protein
MRGETSAGVRRRYRRVKGPFSGRLLGPTKTLIFITDLNLGGGFINFFEQPPEESTFIVRINLREGPIIVQAETVSRRGSGHGVRFVNMDTHAAVRLERTTESPRSVNYGLEQPSH